MRQAMQQVQTEYVVLQDLLEAGLSEPQNFTVRRQADRLTAALGAPALTADSGVTAEPNFREHLAETIAAVLEVHDVARAFDAENTWATRDGISYACQNCHDVYRRP